VDILYERKRKKTEKKRRKIFFALEMSASRSIFQHDDFLHHVAHATPCAVEASMLNLKLKLMN